MDKICGLQVLRACPTRWWTEYLMCERVVEISSKEKEALNQVIKTCDWKDKDKKKFRKLTNNDHDLLDHYVNFFRLFKDKSDMMGGEDFSNIHYVHSTVKLFRRHIDKWSEHAVIGSFVSDFSKIFSEYFDFIDHPEHPDYMEIYSITAYLSPYHQPMLTSSEKKRAKEYLMEEVLLREDVHDEVAGGKGAAKPQTKPQDAAVANQMPPGK